MGWMYILRDLQEKLNAKSPYGNVQVRGYNASMSTEVIERSLNDAVVSITTNPKGHLAGKINWLYMPVYNGIDEAIQAMIKQDRGNGYCFAVMYMQPDVAHEDIWKQAYNRLMTAFATYKQYSEHPRGAATPVAQARKELLAAQEAYKQVIASGIMTKYWLVKTDFEGQVMNMSGV